MNRFHVHLSVKDLGESIRFYEGLFGQAPTVRKEDYAKWHLQDPAVNFAISTRQEQTGLNHLGFQFEDPKTLREQESRVRDAGLQAINEENAACCYARSDKHWVLDPQGIPWEAFHTLENIPVFGGSDLSALQKEKDGSREREGQTRTSCC